jgi:hypothetical protein
MNPFTEFHQNLETPERYLFQVKSDPEIPWYFEVPDCMFCGSPGPRKSIVLFYKTRKEDQEVLDQLTLCPDCAFVVFKIIEIYWEHSGE